MRAGAEDPTVNNANEMQMEMRPLCGSKGMSNSKTRRGDIYHLLAERGNYTLCGLRIRPLSPDTRRSPDEKSPGETLCKHCERIDKQGP